MQMGQEKVHTLFFYKRNKYLLEKKIPCLSSILSRALRPEGYAAKTKCPATGTLSAYFYRLPKLFFMKMH